jgi:hypothetical protein
MGGMPGTTKAENGNDQPRKKIREQENSDRPKKLGPKKKGVGEDVRLQAFRDQ